MTTLYVALYDLSSPHEKVLKFKRGDRFIPLSESNNNWALSVDLRGNVGFVPVTYVQSETVSKDVFASLIENVLETLHHRFSKGYSKQQREAIQELSAKRAAFVNQSDSLQEFMENSEGSYERAAYKETQRRTSEIICNEVSEDSGKTSSERTSENSSVVNDSANSSHESNSEMVNSITVPNGLSLGEHEPAGKSNFSENVHNAIESVSKLATEKNKHSTQNDLCANCKKCANICIPPWLIPKLIENVRHETQLSHQNSKRTISVILNALNEAVPSLTDIWDQLKDKLEEFEFEIKPEAIIISEDKEKLLEIIKQLWYCKNDEQQRSWPVHEDEDVIKKLLENLNSILMDADPRISRVVIQRDDYEVVNVLVTYYQMEARRTLRLEMLKVFVTLCELDLAIVSILLTSVLPMELARDMQCTFEDNVKVEYSAFLLTIIFSTGQKPPNGIYEFINKTTFLQFLFEHIESCGRNGDDDMAQHLLNIVLAFNLHLQDFHQNPVLQALKDHQDGRILTEKLVFLLNREDDPTKILNHELETPNSILKFMVDLFSSPELVQLFYLNDVKVLLDITVRQLTDHLPGEKKRLLYLQLVKNILKNSSYEEHYHQQTGLKKCFKTVLNQEVPCPEEVSLVQDILQWFFSWFSDVF